MIEYTSIFKQKMTNNAMTYFMFEYNFIDT